MARKSWMNTFSYELPDGRPRCTALNDVRLGRANEVVTDAKRQCESAGVRVYAHPAGPRVCCWVHYEAATNETRPAPIEWVQDLGRLKGV